MKKIYTTLIFPPLVPASFGAYYPSIALLSAVLKENNFQTLQLDLNMKFAEHVCSVNFLKKFIKNNSVKNFLLAKTLLKVRSKLYSTDNKYNFDNESNPFANILHSFAAKFTIDTDLLKIKDLYQIENAKFYYDFYDKILINKTFSKSTLIGISVPMGVQIIPTLILCDVIKKKYPDKIVVLGGHTFSLLNIATLESILLKFKFINGIVRYDGEEALLTICDQVKNNSWQPENIPNFSFRKKTKVIHTKYSQFRDLNIIPFFDYSKTITQKLSNPYYSVLHARGCYWGKCIFCNYRETYVPGLNYKSVTPFRLFSALKYHFEENKMINFSIISESLSPQFLNEFCDFIIQSELKINWTSFVMVNNKFTSALFKKMILAGCESIVVGVESMNNRVLKFIGKMTKQEEIIDFLLKAKEAGIVTKINIIPDLPTSTKDEAIETLELVRKYKNCISGLSVFHFELTRSSEIGKFPEKYGISLKNQKKSLNRSHFCSNNLDFIDNAMSKTEKEFIFKKFRELSNEINLQKADSNCHCEEKFNYENINSKYLKCNPNLVNINHRNKNYLIDVTTLGWSQINRTLSNVFKIILEKKGNQNVADLIDYFCIENKNDFYNYLITLHNEKIIQLV